LFDKVKISKKYLNIAMITLVIGIILLFVYQLSLKSSDIVLWTKSFLTNFLSVISPILYAFVISYILYRPLMFIERNFKKGFKKISKKGISNGMARTISILLLAILVFFAIYTLINSIFPPLIENIDTVMQSLPNFQTIITEWINNLTPYIKAVSITNEQIQEFTLFLTNLLKGLLTNALNIGTGVVTNLTGLVINTLATIILTFYFLKDKETIFAGIDKLGTVIFKPQIKAKIKHFLHDLHEVFGNFIVGQLIDAAIVDVASSLLLLIIGHPFALLIGLIAGVTNIIPYVGPIIGAALALILGLFTSVKLGILGFILLIAYQQIDGYFIQPKILGDSVGLAPVWIFIAILIGGNYLGALGMILSVPIAALCKVYIDRRFQKLETRA
jgi:putative membrane protein